MQHYGALVEALRGSENQVSELTRQLRIALGVTAKSERRPSQRPRGPSPLGPQPKPKTEREKLLRELLDSTSRAKRCRDLARKHGSKMVSTQNKLDGLPPDEGDDTDREWTPEEAAELEREHQEMLTRCQLGDGSDPSLRSVTETLLAGAEVTTKQESVYLEAPEPDDDAALVETRVEQRVRYDFTLVVGRVVAEVEKKIVVDADGRKRMLSASTRSLGPPRIGVTWRFLVNTMVMVGQYAMPMNRLAQMLTTSDKKFTSASLYRLLRYAAERFAPIYLQLFDQLADAEILMGDDTPPRVLEVRRYFTKVKAGTEPGEQPPWAAYRTMDTAVEAARTGDDGLEVQLARELGFESARRNGDGPKRSLNTTVVAGRADDSDPDSLIVFYRSHLGSLGNLLELLLERRDPKAGGVIIQSDLATTNRVRDEALLERFPIRRVGCASHARRPFAIHEADDEKMCGAMLDYFSGLFVYEDLLDCYGRNRDNVAAVRDVDHRQTWGDIHRCASLMERIWSRETKLGEAARYVLRHFDALTAYLDDPRLEPTNNFAERMLRLEKLIEGSSMFRATLGGRFVLDILRTVMQTAVAARAPLQEYLLNILQTDPAVIAAAPERYTPRAWMELFGDALAELDEQDQQFAECEPTDTSDEVSIDPNDILDIIGDDCGREADYAGDTDDAEVNAPDDAATDFNIDHDHRDELTRDLPDGDPGKRADDLFEDEPPDEPPTPAAAQPRSSPTPRIRSSAANKRNRKRRTKRRK